MAEKESGGVSSGVGIITQAATRMAEAVTSVFRAITRDGHLAAAGRLGVDELGEALKAFPDSIQKQEPGTIWNPTQGEVTADRKASRHVHPTTYGASASRSPGEIARDDRPYAPPDHPQGPEPSHGPEI